MQDEGPGLSKTPVVDTMTPHLRINRYNTAIGSVGGVATVISLFADHPEYTTIIAIVLIISMFFSLEAGEIQTTSNWPKMPELAPILECTGQFKDLCVETKSEKSLFKTTQTQSVKLKQRDKDQK